MKFDLSGFLICAAPCSSNYGNLSVLVSAFADIEKFFEFVRAEELSPEQFLEFMVPTMSCY
ncbi:MAG: hypothetical protein MJY85_03125 [Fibrobacter sp.]|nr:hypothetical protein [Fibrobacter sp.]